MQKIKKITAKALSVLLALMMIINTAMPVYAEVNEQPGNNEIVENVTPEVTPTPDITPVPTEPSSSSSITTELPTDSEKIPESVPESTPEVSPPTETPPVEEVPPVEEELPPIEEEKPVFKPLEVEGFNNIAEILEDGTAKFSVKLNRDDILVNYQWQINKPIVAEEKELLFDYSSYSDTSYFFPFDVITKAGKI